jgi:hypothetical protein
MTTETPGSPAIISRADVATDAAGRYARQLLSHLGGKLDFTTEGGTSTASIGNATGQIIVDDAVLTLIASGDDAGAVSRVEHVLGSHLERFGRRNELEATWTRASNVTGTQGQSPTSPPVSSLTKAP